MKLSTQLPKAQQNFESFINSELTSLQRRVEILKERGQLLRSKSKEIKGLAFQIQTAETKLRHKIQQYTKLYSELNTSKKNIIVSETQSLAHQIKAITKENEQLEMVK